MSVSQRSVGPCFFVSVQHDHVPIMYHLYSGVNVLFYATSCRCGSFGTFTLYTSFSSDEVK